MADPILHLKDSYYFEVPKSMWKVRHNELADFDDFWVRLDPHYLGWEAELVYHDIQGQIDGIPAWHDLASNYAHWLHTGHNSGKPFIEFVKLQPWYQRSLQANADLATQLEMAHQTARGRLDEYRQDNQWSKDKVDGYNQVLSGHIVIPQPFGELKNLYEPASGLCISKYMVIQVVVAVLVAWFFIGLAQRIQNGKTPKGGFWNFLEAILLFLRDQVARPAIGGHDADKFVPILWTIFLFILGCNLMGMIPWIGTPTGAFGTTIGLAIVTLATGIISGSKKFGAWGYWKNQVPHMDVPGVMKVVLVPFIWMLEVVGMLVRHGVLAVRLLANMVAGHLVLLSIMLLAFGIEAPTGGAWWFTAPIVLFGSTLFSCLELFVAFLQAYIFTFLSALFIGAAVHHH